VLVACACACVRGLTRYNAPQHLVHEFSVENLRGWEEIEAWKSQYSVMSLKERVLQARRLYQVRAPACLLPPRLTFARARKAFIPSSAFLQLNISAMDRMALQDFFALAEDEVASKLTPALFDNVVRELVKMMMGSFERFQRTSLFKQGQQQVHVAPAEDV
jgi:hypothetical protein